ncbi:MAG TPA: hypothetical protein VF211_16570 [Burkholderiales bacterium]
MEKRAGYIKAEMVERDTAEETREFVAAILAEIRKGETRVLVSTRKSRPVYKVESWDLSGTLDTLLPLKDRLKVALISDARELAMSQEYIELLARQRGLDFRTFQSEQAAAAWLTAATE